MGPLVSLPLQGLARYLPLLAGGAAAASQTDPKGLEYLKEGLSSLINPASYSLNPLEDILESKIIKFPEKNKGSEDNQTPNKDPDQNPKIPPSGIGEVLDLIKNKDENKTKKTTISMFDEGYEGQLMKNLMSGLNKLGEDNRDIWFKVTQSPLYELEKMVSELPSYATDKNEMEKLKVLKEKFVEEVGETQEPIIKKKKRNFENDPIGLLVSDGSIDAAVDLIAGDEDMYFMYKEWYEDKLLNLQETLEDREGFDLYEDSLLKQQIQKLKDNYTTDEGIKDYILERDAEIAERYEDEVIYPDPKKPTKNPLEDILESQIQNKEKEDTRGEGKQYHGAREDIQSLVDGYYNNKNFYGNGFYTTDALDVAKGYKRGKEKGSIYEVIDRKENKLFNLENKMTEKNIKDFENYLGPSLLESINFNLNNFKGKTWKESYDEIRDDLISEDFTADEVTDELDIINEFFAKDGYDGITYKGGKLTGTEPHLVKQYFNPEESIEVVTKKKDK
jgi:hypothetical protein